MRKQITCASSLVKNQCGSFCCQRRFVRKRSGKRSAAESSPDVVSYASTSQPAEEEPYLPGVAGLRSGGMMAAPATTSLDRIRSQVRAMQEEAQERAELAALSARQQTRSAAERHRELTEVVKNSFVRRQKPNAAYYDSKDARERVAMRSEIVKRTLLNEVDEVVRKPKEADTVRFLQLAFPHALLGSNAATSMAEQLRGEWRNALSVLRKTVPDGLVSEEDLKERSWLDVLEKKSADELRLIWQSGLLDLADVERLLTAPQSNVSVADDNDVSVAVGNNSSDEVDQGGAAKDTDSEHVLPLADRVERLHDIHYLQELAKELKTGVLPGDGASAGVSVDLAPVLQKVHEKRFDDITDKELKALEAYEEAPIHLGSSRGRENDESAINRNLTESAIDRALSPSNRLLFFVAGKDDKVRRSLDVLERVKRHALFDPVFQEAVRVAHEMEETSVDGHVRGVPDASITHSADPQRLRAVLGEDKVSSSTEDAEAGSQKRGSAAASGVKTVLSPRKRRTLHRRAAALSRPHHAADVPYFFGNLRSIVPPRGSFNLPQPALSPEERAERRGRRRRLRGRTRYSK